MTVTELPGKGEEFYMTYRDRELYIDETHLEDFGENIARSLKPQGSAPARSCALEISENLRAIRSAHDKLQRRFSASDSVPEFAQWLLDNWYLAQREGLQAARAFRESKHLRACNEGVLLSALCRALVRSGRGRVDEIRFELFLNGFQKITVLELDELNLLRDALCAALISRLAEICSRVDTLAHDESAPDSLRRIFSSLRLLGGLDMSPLLEQADVAGQILRRDPAGVYPVMDKQTQQSYRRQLSKLARSYRVSEHRAARRILELAENSKDDAAHVGYWLFTMPLGNEPKVRNGSWYIAGNVLLTAFFSLFLGLGLDSILAAVLLVLPVSELVKSLLDFIILRVVHPRAIPRLALKGGAPEEGRTICVISALLTSPDGAVALAKSLEEYSLANREAGRNLRFGILADLPESNTPELPSDSDCLGTAQKAIDALNEKYGGGFFLFYRDRVYHAPDGKYRGYERKRGAITELARLICGMPNAIITAAGNIYDLEGTKYILTLDEDTKLCPGTARELIGAMLHPLNRPVVDERRGVVISGHAVMQPRMSVSLKSAIASDFSRIFAGQGGLDPYGGLTGELYMDAFGSGIFAGKGIIDAKVYLECTENRLPEARVLSHDALESAYLRAAFVGDVELTDSFPSSVLSYYKRLHRWVRGDWQNLPWLFARGRNLSQLDRWKLFDSVRRSLVPPLTLFALLAGFFLPGKAMGTAAAAALISIASQFLLSMADRLFRRGSEGKTRYHSVVLGGAVGALTQTAAKLILLPFEAWVCLSAAWIALWRTLISHKNMLSWQTFAQSSGKTKGILGFIKPMWPCFLCAIPVMLFSPAVIGRAAGVIWLFAPLYAKALSRESRRQKKLPEHDREYLLGCAEDIWRWFSLVCTEKENYLPPDNRQEQPPVGTAHRTSPTNIGLYLASCVCAVELGLASPDDALTRIEKTISTIEKLPKWRGQLYNWYNTETLTVLEPAYVSTVDSGNFAASLQAAAEGVKKLGAESLAARMDAILDAMDFSTLFDEKRCLFYIGWETARPAPAKSWYDLMSSEARLTAYVAIAKGDIPRKHWRKLSRALLQKDGFQGMASWSGTMFEYLMPELFLPLCRESLLWETARFCLYAQKRKRGSAQVWGASESAYFSLDPALNYRYKAQGCQALALQRGVDDELVFSPYSSFLALCVDPAGAVRNLRKMESLGMRDRFGFWEALDETPSRVGEGGKACVKCVMAHHLGMSFISIANELCDGFCQKLFMSDPKNSAYRELLEEKLPIGGVVLRRLNSRSERQAIPRPGGLWRSQDEGVDFENPACTLLSNGAYGLCLTESGLSLPLGQELIPYRKPQRRLGDGHGVELYLELGGQRFSALPEPNGSGMTFSWSMDCEKTVISSRGKGLECTLETQVADGLMGETRTIKISSTNGNAIDVTTEISFIPVLAGEKDYINHPAFYRLGLETESTDRTLLIRRLARGKNAESFLCLACDRTADFTIDRIVPGRPRPARRNSGWSSDPEIRARVNLSPGSEPDSVRFALCLGATAKEAQEGAALCLAQKTGACLPVMAARQLSLGTKELGEAMFSSAKLVFPRVAGKVSLGRETLWRFGISGDLPIICAVFDDLDKLDSAETLMRRHAFLSTCSLRSDLVFLTDDGGDYGRPAHSALLSALRRIGREGVLDAPGGVHIAPLKDCAGCLPESAAEFISLGGPENPPVRRTDRHYSSLKPAPYAVGQPELKTEWKPDGSFGYYVSRALPPRTWQNMLTNGHFGFIATDAGTGHMWFENARETRLTPWLCDSLTTSGVETLTVTLDDGAHSLFAFPGDGESVVTNGFGFTVWQRNFSGLSIKTTAFVPPETNARVLIIEGAGNHRVDWTCRLLLGSDDADSAFVCVENENGVLTAENARSARPDLRFRAVSSPSADSNSGDLLSFLRGGEPGGEPAFCMSLSGKDLVIVCGCDSSDKLKALAKIENARLALQETKSWWLSRLDKLIIKTGDEKLDNILRWTPYQALAGRLMGRTSVYQSGGALGFRDQLQDAVNLLLLSPEYARERILDGCLHQYSEGDVMHWWHPMPDGDKGVRTRCSDDLVWLPWALCEYVDATGDISLCSEKRRFLSSPPLTDSEGDRYESPALTADSESVFDHAKRALLLTLKRGTGDHGLLLFGSGDWNDGMDKVNGESVWLSWFFAHVARRFCSLAEKLNENCSALLDDASRIGQAADSSRNGEHYLRGWFPDGTPLGADSEPACRIDSVAQSFSTLCPEADSDMVNRALREAVNRLFDRKNNVVRLFEPPFAGQGPKPGYIESYGPGFRENGGQYTHGAIWLGMACLKAGMLDEGFRILRALIPENHKQSEYMAEPYVLAADVYTNPDHMAQAGWSWYTGSAGWFFRVVAEDLLGLKMRGGKLFIEPNLPASLPAYSALWRDSNGVTHNINVKENTIQVDKKSHNGGGI